MPSWAHFDAQDAAYKADILPAGVLRASIEAGTTFGWERYTGLDGLRFGIDSFGASAPAEVLYDHFGLTAAKIAPQIKAALGA
jgi:transketolase